MSKTLFAKAANGANHSCRHIYVTYLYRASDADLELVQEQRGHADVKTTTIYAKVTKEDKLRAANGLATLFRDSQQNGGPGASWARNLSRTIHNPCGSVGRS